MNTATHAVTHGTAAPIGFEFDKATQHLVKVRDSFENTFIFSLPKTTVGTYANTMSKGKLVAYRLNDAKEFRKPHTQETLPENDFRFLKAVPVGDSVKTFLKRIAKVMEPETTEILRGKMRGVEKLAGLKVAKEAATATKVPKKSRVVSAGASGVVESGEQKESAPGEQNAGAKDQTGEQPILYKGKPLEKIGNSYFIVGTETCIHCQGEIKTKAQVSVINGIAKTQATKKATNRDAGRVEGSRSEWEHYACRDAKGSVESSATKHHDLNGDELAGTKAESGSSDLPEVQHVISDMMSALTRTDVSADWKVGYLTGKYETK